MAAPTPLNGEALARPSSTLLCPKLHARQAFEVCVLRPQRRFGLPGSRKYDAVGEGQLRVASNLGRNQRQSGIKVYDTPLLHHRHHLKRRAFTSLLTYPFEYF